MQWLVVVIYVTYITTVVSCCLALLTLHCDFPASAMGLLNVFDMMVKVCLCLLQFNL